ncbi:glutathione S-transferase-like protein [Thermochaetoides thermophila DSM 1495]|uniref:Glutathione S-transferase-like protein n=1 Tax=Chaetomium thermophilum (strain DSM 1495 / CBS 144.50 / IMI 039719) TaxID=759272 RepID=G0SGH6_CHATD|nr:glutathione S-transferase-like protein [Thermochaetoides thermophila DSM 1495]EGS17315.1 glutathione S-transferase-like protein [Thermochaetoides thermophila DSM 1495]
MPTVVTVPDEYGYVLLAATSTFFVNTLHAILTVTARKAAGQKYPIAYASNEVAEKDRKAYLFNCAQRAHANFTENLTPFLGALLIGGLKYPDAAAGLGATWSLCRAAYAIGYSKKGPEGRVIGGTIASLSDLILKFMALSAGVGLALGW